MIIAIRSSRIKIILAIVSACIIITGLVWMVGIIASDHTFVGGQQVGAYPDGEEGKASAGS